MNKRTLQGNAAAIDRLRLIERVRSSQSRLSRQAGRRFDAFAQRQGGAIYEFASERSLELAFTRFEWEEMDRLYCNLVAHILGLRRCNARAHTRAVRTIAVDKLLRLFIKGSVAALNLTRQVSELTVLVCLFAAISSITSEALLHFTR